MKGQWPPERAYGVRPRRQTTPEAWHSQPKGPGPGTDERDESPWPSGLGTPDERPDPSGFGTERQMVVEMWCGVV
ncbi:hypothetical protein PG993_010973 [Apiospora rasikravindrae]|uniref:Uncharacterized protein n=1 Tax=Apiospora rasikravindrae TaxID=990691 RepID=A0ABR1SF48_9PEZI